MLVIGAKRSGLAAIELLLKRGARVRAMDAQVLTTEEQAKFDAMGVPVVAQQAGEYSRSRRTIPISLSCRPRFPMICRC